MERENLCLVTPPGVKGQAASGSNREGESTEAGRIDAAPESAGDEAAQALGGVLRDINRPANGTR